jgi:hypothetical protein
MRLIAVLSTVVLISSVLVAQKAAPPPRVAASEGAAIAKDLQFINEHLYISQDYTKGNCRDRMQLSLSENRQEMLLKHFVVDGSDRIKPNTPPTYVYHIAVSSIDRTYLSGPWATNDRVVLRTNGRGVMKVGPVWDCNHNKVNRSPKKALLDSVEFRIRYLDEGNLDHLKTAVDGLVNQLQAELKAKAASQQKETPAQEKQDSLPNQK